jgi:hypothetical protein
MGVNMRALILCMSLLLGVEAFSAGVGYELKDIVLSWETPVDREDGTPLDPNDILEYELEAMLTAACEDSETLSCAKIFSWIPEHMVAVRGRYYYVIEVYLVTLGASENLNIFEDVPDFDWVLSMRTITKTGLASQRSDYVVLNRGFFAIACTTGQETICLTDEAISH